MVYLLACCFSWAQTWSFPSRKWTKFEAELRIKLIFRIFLVWFHTLDDDILDVVQKLFMSLPWERFGCVHTIRKAAYSAFEAVRLFVFRLQLWALIVCRKFFKAGYIRKFLPTNETLKTIPGPHLSLTPLLGSEKSKNKHKRLVRSRSPTPEGKLLIKMERLEKIKFLCNYFSQAEISWII